MQTMISKTHAIGTLADLDNWLLSCSSMQPNRRYERRAAIRRTCKWASLPASKIPADPNDLRKRFAGFSPGGLKVTRKSVSNTKSAVLAAARAAGILPKRIHVDEFLPSWNAVWDILSDAEKRQLSRMFRCASANGISPEMVDEAFSRMLLEHYLLASLKENCKAAHQNACRAWNRVRERVPGRPGETLIVPQYMQRVSLPTTVFPEALWAQFEAFCKMMATTNYFDKRAPEKPLRPRSIKSYQKRFLMYISALVIAGYKSEDIQNLGFCVEKKQVKAGLEALLDWRKKPGYEARHSAAACAILLQTIMKRAIAKPKKADVEFLNMTAKKLCVRHKGMSPRNRKKVVALKQEANLARLFIMPLTIAKALVDLRDDEITDSDALLLEKVLALIILMFCPLRIGTLVSLHLDDNMVWGGRDMTGGLTLNIDEVQMKGGEHAAVMPLPNKCSDLIREYVRRFRNRRAPDGCRFLFVGERTDRGKDENTLSKQIKALVFDRLGFDVTAHIYRHIVHIVVLNRFPGAYAMVARVLTHRNINTTIQNYSYMDVELSMKAYQELVLDEVTPGAQCKRPTAADIAYGIDREKL